MDGGEPAGGGSEMGRLGDGEGGTNAGTEGWREGVSEDGGFSRHECAGGLQYEWRVERDGEMGGI